MACRNERKPAGREGQIGLQQPLELQQRLVVEADVVEIARASRPGLGQAVVDGVLRKPGVVLLAGEAFFLGGGDDPAVDDQAAAES